MMSRKHFESLATELAEIRPSTAHADRFSQWVASVYSVASVCARYNNGSFDFERFVKACYGRQSFSQYA